MRPLHSYLFKRYKGLLLANSFALFLTGLPNSANASE